MHAHNWILWALLAAAFLVAPVILRAFVGDDPPDNAIRQEQPGGGEREPAAQEQSAGGEEFRLVA